MNNSLKKLLKIAKKQQRYIIGLMSGTSMDGLDIALCKFEGSGLQTKISLINFKTATYTENFKVKLKAIFSTRNADMQEVCLLNEEIGILHAQLINEALKEWGVDNSSVDLIASHGQTIFHAPTSFHQLKNRRNATLQIGDGDHIAVHTGIITLCDFRQKHLAAGGEGAPLAVYGDYLLFSKAVENRIMLNIGGISNFTFLPSSLHASDVFSTDIGPGNTMMDQFVQRHYPHLFYDENANLAKKGQVNEALLTSLLKNPFFTAEFPKSTGPEMFNLQYLEWAQQQSSTEKIANVDILATLCHFSAKAIINAINKCFVSNQTLHIYLSGGGSHNPLLVSLLEKGLPNITFSTTDSLAINPDAKEAVLFALLANESVVGNAINFGTQMGVPSVCMGKICFPN